MTGGGLWAFRCSRGLGAPGVLGEGEEGGGLCGQDRAAGSVRARRAGTWGCGWGREHGHEHVRRREGADESVRTMLQGACRTIAA